MHYISNKKNNNYNIKILNNIEQIKNIFDSINVKLKNYKYVLDIYMVNKKENFYNIKKLSDIKNYAIIRDNNGNRSVILNDENIQSAKIHSIFFTHNILYNFGYYELFHLNKDIYEYEFQNDENDKIDFNIIEVKEQGCYFNINNMSLKNFKSLMKNLKKVGFKFDLKNYQVDYLQLELNKVIFKK